MQKPWSALTTIRMIIVPYIIPVICPLICFLNVALDEVGGEIAALVGIAVWLIGMVLVYPASYVLTVVDVCRAIKRKVPAKAILRSNLMIKCAQIPAYLLVFFLGLMLMVTIFTWPFAIVLILVDCFTVLLSGIVAVAGLLRAVSDKQISKGWAVVLSFASFLFCVDVVAAIIAYLSVKAPKDIA